MAFPAKSSSAGLGCPEAPGVDALKDPGPCTHAAPHTHRWRRTQFAIRRVFFIGPVRRGGFFGFDEALVEQHGHRAAHAHVLAVAAFAKNHVQLKHALQVDPELVDDAAAVIAQAEAGLDDVR